MDELTGAVSRQYDLFQTSLESIEKPRKYLNYGYTVARRQTYEERQERLCMEVFRAAQIEPQHVLVDVGFGSGEQDFLLERSFPFTRLTGFNISAKQVEYASTRAAQENLAHKLEFRHGQAEELPGIAPGSVDRVMAVECAFYFDRPRFYARAAEVLKPGGLLVLADIAFTGRMPRFARSSDDLQRVGTRDANQKEWERFFTTRPIVDIAPYTRPGAQMTVTQILRSLPRMKMSGGERREWLKMAWYSQLVALGLATGLLHYDLIVLERI
jgi:cyclopropane fatty-acyl-phospholipid synthase-like methyltransferase